MALGESGRQAPHITIRWIKAVWDCVREVWNAKFQVESTA